ncbi:hypothetical protein JCM11641_004939 [Rhodosporidiobolus odoratus]
MDTDTLFDWSQHVPAQHTSLPRSDGRRGGPPHLPTSPGPASTAISSAGSVLSLVDEAKVDDDSASWRMFSDVSDGGDWRFEEDAEMDEGEEEQDEELLDMRDYDEQDDLPELSFSSPSSASTASSELATSSPLDLDAAAAPACSTSRRAQIREVDTYEEGVDLQSSLKASAHEQDRLCGPSSTNLRSPLVAEIIKPMQLIRHTPFDDAPSPSMLPRSPKRRRLSLDLTLTDSLAAVSEPSPIEPASAFGLTSKSRPMSPTQAEMDAFFGYKGADTPPLPPAKSVAPPSPAQPASALAATPLAAQVESLRRDVEQKASERTSGKNGARHNKDRKAERQYYQLEPIPALSFATGEALTAEEKRLAIIGSLRKLALAVLVQVVDNVVPPRNDESRLEDVARPPRWQQLKVKLVKRSRRDEGDTGAPRLHSILFPRKCGQGADIRLGGRELACLLRVVELIIDGLDNRIVTTKRDLFYRDVALFSKQSTVDAIVEDIAATLQVRRSDLNVVAAAKGLFAGSLTIVTTEGKELRGDGQGVLIPPSQCIEQVRLEEVKWVLVVEKEAVFSTLAGSELLEDSSIGHGVLLTGKGYPDLATRELVKRLADELPSTPILALVDADPHGLEILSTYRFGSASLSFDAANLVVDRISWLGVKASEWDTLGIDRDELLPLTKADRTKALAMLKREWLPEDWRRELEYMLHLGRKAEIQILSSAQPSQSRSRNTVTNSSQSGSRLVDYVGSKIRMAVGIAEDGDSVDS